MVSLETYSFAFFFFSGLKEYYSELQLPEKDKSLLSHLF
jgi:hypothetical protein